MPMYWNEARRLEFLVPLIVRTNESLCLTVLDFWTALAQKFTTDSPLIK